MILYARNPLGFLRSTGSLGECLEVIKVPLVYPSRQRYSCDRSWLPGVDEVSKKDHQ